MSDSVDTLAWNQERSAWYLYFILSCFVGSGFLGSAFFHPISSEVNFILRVDYDAKLGRSLEALIRKTLLCLSVILQPREGFGRVNSNQFYRSSPISLLPATIKSCTNQFHFFLYRLPHQTINPVTGNDAQIKLTMNARIFPGKPKIAPT